MNPAESNVEYLKVPPHSLEAEQSMLGALLLDNQAFESISDIVAESDLYRDNHRRIWREICKAIEAGNPADILTITAALDSAGDLDKAGGPAYIGQLAQNTPSALNIVRYAELVREKSVRRQLAHIGSGIAEEALGTGDKDVGRMLDEAESKILQIGESAARRSDGLMSISPVLAKVFEQMDDLYHRDNPSDVTGVPTGYLKIDEMTSGLQPGDLVIVAGRPSMGKTALALNIAEHVAMHAALPVAIFSMEMSASQLGKRLLGSIARVDQHKMRTGKLNDREWGDLADAMGKLHELPIFIDESGALNALELRARARRWRRRYSTVGLVVVDYLQLMTATSSGENRATEISEISRSLKAMAKELGCPVIALSQLNRAVDQRPDRRPVMSDLRESGAIEQDADVIFFVYREVVYKPDLPAAQRGLAEVIIGKQRNGPIGTVKLTFLGQHTRFENYIDMDTGSY